MICTFGPVVNLSWKPSETPQLHLPSGCAASDKTSQEKSVVAEARSAWRAARAIRWEESRKLPARCRIYRFYASIERETHRHTRRRAHAAPPPAELIPKPMHFLWCDALLCGVLHLPRVRYALSRGVCCPFIAQICRAFILHGLTVYSLDCVDSLFRWILMDSVHEIVDTRFYADVLVASKGKRLAVFEK